MVLRDVFVAALCATSLAWCGASLADQYRAEEFLGLDLSTAVISPKPLGPAATFAPGPLDVTVDPESHRAQAIVEPKTEPSAVGHISRAHPRAEPRVVARTKIVHHRRNPLDAQALDSRVQLWPCKSGGICNWKR